VAGPLRDSDLHSTLYRRASLYGTGQSGRAFENATDGSYAGLLGKIARVDVLVIDDWALTTPREAEKNDLLEVLEDRCGNRATIMTSQVDLAPAPR
jgi:hypothetical protein